LFSKRRQLYKNIPAIEGSINLAALTIDEFRASEWAIRSILCLFHLSAGENNQTEKN